jgi:hypothetical protein
MTQGSCHSSRHWQSAMVQLMKSIAASTAVALAVSVAMTASSGCSSKSSPSNQVSAEQASQLLLNRNWLDVMPENHTDRLHVFRFVPTMGGGVYQDRTLFKGTFELFKFEATGSEIRFVLPETRERVRAAYTIETVTGPAPFDLRLSIPDSPRGPKTYYGMRSETDRDGQLLENRLHALAGD